MSRIIVFALLFTVCFFQNIQAAEMDKSCKRENLAAVADAYISAIKKGDTSLMPLATGAKYIENRKPFSFTEGIWKGPMIVDFYRTVIDTEACETFTEVIGATATDPYVMGTRIKISDGKVTEIEALITNKDDWLFNAETYLKYSPKEKWDILAPEMRSDRQTLIRIANAYFNVFKDSSALKEVPWNIPCERLEGGIYTNPENKPDASCTGGPPLEGSIEITNRRFIVDVDMGVVVGMVDFGEKDGWPDTHMFRVENGRVRYVHTLTVCPNGCDLPAPKK